MAPTTKRGRTTGAGRRLTLLSPLLAALLASSTGCASSRSLLHQPVGPGSSERFERGTDEVLEATVAAVRDVGMEVDEIVDGPGVARTVLASRGASLMDYGAIARLTIEEAAKSEDGTWVHIGSRLKMGTNFAGKSDYREDLFSGIRRELARASPASNRPATPFVAYGSSVRDSLRVGTRLRVEGRRVIVSEIDAAHVVLDDPLRAAPERVDRDELLARTQGVERLIREPYRWERLLLASVIGGGLGLWLASDSGGLPLTGAYIAVSSVITGAIAADRGRVQWRTQR